MPVDSERSAKLQLEYAVYEITDLEQLIRKDQKAV
jgi:hypothetical protein